MTKDVMTKDAIIEGVFVPREVFDKLICGYEEQLYEMKCKLESSQKKIDSLKGQRAYLLSKIEELK